MQSLRAWLGENAAFCDDRLALERDSLGHARVAALASIPATTTVGRIPKSLVLSHRTSSLSLDDSTRSTLDSLPPARRLVVHVAHELLLGAQSRWHVYLASCPAKEVPVALLWDDGEASTWLQGTQVERERRRIGMNRTRLRDFYTSALPLLLRQARTTAPSFEVFALAYYLVSSRAFQVDAYHSLALVPLADVFNHSDPPHVHFASETWVCPECGKLDRCEHDDAGELVPNADVKIAAEDDTCDMVVEQAIEAGEEVFNTYGQLSNAKLLASYGFLLEANEHDAIEFDLDEATESCLPRGIPSDAFTERYSKFRTLEINICVDIDNPLLRPTDPADLNIDADGRLSTGLWCLVLAAAELSAQVSATSLITVASLAGVVGRMASEKEVAGDEGAGIATRFLPSVEEVSMHRPDLDAAALLDLAEGTEDTKVRLALQYLAGERLILERVEQQWSDLS
ncbi:SET domain containing protein [Rhodotorula toruloides]|uniref:SET domain containing protein n=1 Tax=Rhodotorula toruloides TaxID=5286 RepID=A0A511KPF2_RHOTO|nr:SET domain containing protein [Rhodotorula toruloides]